MQHFFSQIYIATNKLFFLIFFFKFPHHHQLMTCWLLDLKVCALNHDRSFVPTYNCVWKKLKKKNTTMMKKNHCEASVENRIKIGSVNQRNEEMIKSPKSKNPRPSPIFVRCSRCLNYFVKCLCRAAKSNKRMQEYSKRNLSLLCSTYHIET